MSWSDCEHEWRDVESQCERDVVCVKCGCPGEREDDGSVFWPAT
jgi:hypothetical protein